MARNWPGPYAVEITYTISSREHSLLLNCIAIGTPAPGTPVASISLATKSAGSILLQTAVDQLWAIVRLAMNAQTSAITYTLWKYTPNSNDKNFIAAGLVALPTGASGVGLTAASYVIVSMRSGAGGVLKVEMLDTIYTLNSQSAIVPNAAATTMPEKLAAYMLSASGWIIARDDSYPVAALRQSYGQNETVWAKINRPN